MYAITSQDGPNENLYFCTDDKKPGRGPHGPAMQRLAAAAGEELNEKILARLFPN